MPDDDRGADLEQQGHERVTRAVEDMAGTVGCGRDPATNDRAAETEEDRQPERHRVGTGQGETGQGADQERREHDREQRAEHVATSLPQGEARPASGRGQVAVDLPVSAVLST